MGLVYLEFSRDAFYHKFIPSFLCEYTGMITVESLSTFSLFAPSLVNCWRFPDPASYLKKNQVLMSQILKISRGQIPPLLVLHQSPCGSVKPEIEVNGRKQEKKGKPSWFSSCLETEVCICWVGALRILPSWKKVWFLLLPLSFKVAFPPSRGWKDNISMWCCYLGMNKVSIAHF